MPFVADHNRAHRFPTLQLKPSKEIKEKIMVSVLQSRTFPPMRNFHSFGYRCDSSCISKLSRKQKSRLP